MDNCRKLHEAIIPNDLFLAAQEILDNNKKKDHFKITRYDLERNPVNKYRGIIFNGNTKLLLIRNGIRSNKKLRNVLSIDASGAYCKDRIIDISKMKIEVVEKHRISLSFRISKLNSDLKKLYEAYSLGTIEKEDYLEERELNRKSLSIYERGGIYFTNIQDEVTNIIESEGEFTIEDFKDYKKKVNRYINENQNHIFIYKLKNNERLTVSDFKELEKILWSEVGTKEEYEREYGDKSLSILVREIVG